MEILLAFFIGLAFLFVSAELAEKAIMSESMAGMAIFSIITAVISGLGLIKLFEIIT